MDDGMIKFLLGKNVQPTPENTAVAMALWKQLQSPETVGPHTFIESQEVHISNVEQITITTDQGVSLEDPTAKPSFVMRAYAGSAKKKEATCWSCPVDIITNLEVYYIKYTGLMKHLIEDVELTTADLEIIRESLSD
jgi:hypothetical protein